ncbi:MAG: hypothetical protein US70_C0033G0003 [Parcubacteria group bacterium GW2011_GWD2_38_11]|nr:MAG: hypothetical protein US70_C0033G0003 [Parcubacteria group bacterium GW2011_GWD2_38_11]
MNAVIISILSIIFIVIVIVAIGLIRFTLNDFIEKTVKKFLWLWLPFHAFGRLTKEFRKKYMK